MEGDGAMKFVIISMVALLTACAGSQLPAPAAAPKPGPRDEAVNCGVLVFTPSSAVRGFERLCLERPVKMAHGAPSAIPKS
jgi:hypothetical protein